MNNIFSAQYIAIFLLMTFFAITFLQSAIDKVIDWKGNLAYISGHFSNSILGKQVPLLLATLTLVEFLSGGFSAYAAIRIILNPNFAPALQALTICGINLLMLLFGQRLAKDYAGASTIAIYFALVMSGFILMKF